MTQKTKVKELVGRGLDSYHTKSLQQIDRIEKKNKEQNHKISILSNELDNDYLTKTEEGSVVSLEHSKEGMVYLDELQGNTLVNYCTDGSKELTLNGDIDVEGTFVTTTEGVDNGKVDVMCEGNTLVNLKYGADGNDCNMAWADSGTIEYFNRQEYSKIHCKGEIVETANNLGISWIYHIMGQIKLHLLKTNTTYTIKLNNKYDCINGIYIQAGNATNSYLKESRKIDKDTYLITTKDSFEGLSTNGIILYGGLSKDYKGNVDYKIIGILEGDWTNREFPTEFFEGMKSVGQDNVNGHKIEILSKNKNLFNPEEVYESGYSYGVPFVNSVKCQEEDGVFTRVTSANTWNAGIGFHVKTEKNKDYTLSVGEYFNDGVNMDIRCIGVYKSEYPFKNNNNMQSYANRIVAKNLDSNNNSLTYNSKDYDYILFYIGGQWNENANGVKTFRMSKIEVNQSSTKPTNYTKQNLNKKEILMNEPLRGFEDGKKDRFIKICGKWYIERNCQLKSSSQFTWLESGRQFENHYCVYVNGLGGKTDSKFLSTSYPYIADAYANKLDASYISNNSSSGYDLITLTIPKSKLTTVDIIGAREYLNNNPFDFMIELATPKYEEITEPILTTYLDITHISNNSIIPCNMKIKNSGYNAIIKPSTLYTIALDTNKSGTIGMNLGGAKGTTTNNVLKLTTPATLSDDSLRIYRKGIKGSKVRILEGDKTNWIPSHFEGMQSSFEDKFDATDNTYKMEILSNNKNVLNLDDIVMKGIGAGCKLDACSTDLIQYTSNQAEWTQIFFMMKLKPFTRYTLSAELQSMNVYVFNDRVGNWDTNKYIGAMQNTTNTLKKNQYSFTTNKNGYISIRFTNERMLGVNIAKNIILSEVVGEYIPKKSNKIQFSSIEPLRRYKNSVDKFVFKDKKLMIERNCTIKIFNGSENWNYSSWINNNGRINRFALDINVPSYSYQISNKYKYIWGDYPDTYYRTDNGTLFVYTQTSKTLSEFKQELKENNLILLGELTEPTYEEIPFELQKIILEGYENGTLFFDTNIPPTSTVTYAGETPIVKATKLNKTEVLNNTEDINDNIIPYLMDMDYRVVMLQLATEELEGRVSMARLFGGTYEMIKRDILSKRLTREEYGYRLADYYNAGKLTEEQVRELEELR